MKETPRGAFDKTMRSRKENYSLSEERKISLHGEKERKNDLKRLKKHKRRQKNRGNKQLELCEK